MRRYCIGLFVGIAGAITTLCHAQANVPTAERVITFETGVALNIASPDYSQGLDKGITAYAAMDLAHNLGIVFEYNNADIVSPRDVGEITYLGGVRYRFPHGRFQPYVKALAGTGQVKFDHGYFQVAQSITNTLYALGGGIEYRVSRKIVVRAADFEVQKWPNFTPHTLTPYVFTTGAAYRF